MGRKLHVAIELRGLRRTHSFVKPSVCSGSNHCAEDSNTLTDDRRKIVDFSHHPSLAKNNPHLLQEVLEQPHCLFTQETP